MKVRTWLICKITSRILWKSTWRENRWWDSWWLWWVMIFLMYHLKVNHWKEKRRWGSTVQQPKYITYQIEFGAELRSRASTYAREFVIRRRKTKRNLWNFLNTCERQGEGSMILGEGMEQINLTFMLTVPPLVMLMVSPTGADCLIWGNNCALFKS